MNRFFNMDNKFFVFMGRVADLLLLNFLCILCCIPVVTAGASIQLSNYRHTEDGKRRRILYCPQLFVLSTT